MAIPATYFTVGTYPDGQVRTSHVTTPDIAGHVAYMTQGFLAFETMVATLCPDIFTCKCGPEAWQ